MAAAAAKAAIPIPIAVMGMPHLVPDRGALGMVQGVELPHEGQGFVAAQGPQVTGEGE